MAARNPVIVALDVPSLDEAADLAARLQGEVGAYKVGLELFSAHGPDAVRRIREHGDVFLDLKLHDIPTTVGRTTAVLRGLGVAMLTVHASGGAEMVAAAVDAMAGEGLVLAVTVLTSLPVEPGEVADRAYQATTAGATGLVCAPRDLAAVRTAVGPDATIVTPGVRLEGTAIDDHARVATPAQALAAGADWLVVGRPITRADDPVAAARAIREGIDRATPEEPAHP